jgi:hypothetical protein
MKLLSFLIILATIAGSIYAKTNTAISDYGLSFKPLSTWHKKDNNFYYGVDGSSINIQSEESLIDLETYTDLTIEKFKKGYSNYKIISKNNENIDGYKTVNVKGTFEFKSKTNNIEMEFNMLVFNLYGEKIVLIITYPKTISKEIKKELLALVNTISFIGNKKNTNVNIDKSSNKKDIPLVWHEDKKNDYKLLIPNNYKLKRDGVFLAKDGNLIAIILEKSDLELREYFTQYITKLKKKYKKISVLEKSFERINGFEVLFVNISTDKMKISNIFYKKSNNVYILTLSGDNKYIEKIKDSFQNIKKI